MSEFTLLLERVFASWQAVGRPRCVLCGLSGGADSVALLSLLVRLSEREGFSVYAIHVHHGLRENADGDAAFAQALCTRLRVPFFISRVRVQEGPSIENMARKVRYEAFLDRMRTLNADALVLAHHADDQAETMLMHWARGSGLRGLCGMREFQGTIWRPLLTVRRRQLRVYVEEAGLDFREDESNMDARFRRNDLRLNAMPALCGALPDFVTSAARTAQLLQDDEDCLESLATLWLSGRVQTRPPVRFLITDGLCEQPVAVARRVVRAFYRRCAGEELDAATTARLMACACDRQGATCNLPLGWRALRTRDRLHLIAPDTLDDWLSYDDWRLETLRESGFGDGKRTQAVAECVLDGACLRVRKPGDIIRPLGMNGTQSLKQYLIDRHVDRPFRNYWPLLARDERVLWVIGVGVSEDAAVRGEGVPYRLLRFWGRLPDEPEIQMPKEMR